MKKTLLLIAAMLTLTGCATSPFGTATTGGANYTYTSTADGACQITINSARDVTGGELLIDSDCSVSVAAQNAGSQDALRVIGDLVGKIK